MSTLRVDTIANTAGTTNNRVLQVASTTTDGVLSTTNNAAPNLIGSGVEVFSLNFTPTKSSSNILVQTSTIAISENTNHNDRCWLSLFNGSTFVGCNSGAAAYLSYLSALNAAHHSLNLIFAAGSTSERAISVRAAMNSSTGGTVYINGNSYSNYTGDQQRISMTVMEIAA
jgi:hypothetical protein